MLLSCGKPLSKEINSIVTLDIYQKHVFICIVMIILFTENRLHIVFTENRLHIAIMSLLCSLIYIVINKQLPR